MLSERKTRLTYNHTRSNVSESFGLTKEHSYNIWTKVKEIIEQMKETHMLVSEVIESLDRQFSDDTEFVFALYVCAVLAGRNEGIALSINTLEKYASDNILEKFVREPRGGIW